MAWQATTLNIAMICGIIILVCSVLGYGLWLILNLKRYNYICRIFMADKDGRMYEQPADKAGIFVDPKTKNKRFFLKKNNVGLNPDNVPMVPRGSDKIVYLLQTGLKNFSYLHMAISKDIKFEVEVGEEDLNWAINAYEKQKSLFSQSLLMQLIPFLTIAFVTLIILVIFIYFFKNFAVLKDVAVELKGAATEIAKAKLGTTVVT